VHYCKCLLSGVANLSPVSITLDFILFGYNLSGAAKSKQPLYYHEMNGNENLFCEVFHSSGVTGACNCEWLVCN